MFHAGLALELSRIIWDDRRAGLGEVDRRAVDRSAPSGFARSEPPRWIVSPPR
jgi:hypothetical protein